MLLGMSWVLVMIWVSMAQRAFLFSSSVGYYNYRQNANLLTVYGMLKKYGFND